MRWTMLAALWLLAVTAAWAQEKPAPRRGAEKAAAVAPNKLAALYAQMAADALKAERPQLLKTCQSGNLSAIYFSSYALDGALAAAEAAAREDCLQVAIECIDAVIAAGKDQNNDGYIDFYHSEKKAWDSTYKGIPSSTLLKGLRPIPRAARVILNRFAASPAYRDKARQYLAFTEKHIIEKLCRQGFLNHYKSGTIHIQSNMGEILTDAYIATGKEEYRKHAEDYAQAVKDNMVLVDGAYVWNQALGNCTLAGSPTSLNGSHVSDTSHGNETIAFVALAARAGIVFTEQDLHRFARTFTNKLWRGPDKPLADFVDGSDWQGKGGVGKWGGFLSAGWCKLGMFSPEVQQLLASRKVHGSYAAQYWGNMALNAAVGPQNAWKLMPSKK